MNKNIVYKVNEKVLIDLEGQKYTTYGIDCYELEDCIEKLVLQIIDISTKFDFIKNIVERFNEMGVSTIHIFDLIDDFL